MPILMNIKYNIYYIYFILKDKERGKYLLKTKTWSNLLISTFNFIEKFFSIYLTGTVILLMMLFITYEVLSRKFFNISTPAVVDLVSLSMLIITFCSLSGIQRDGEHIRIDILVAKLRGNMLFLGRLFEYIITFATCLFLTYSAYKVLNYTIQFNVVSEGARIQKMFFVIFITISLTLLCIRIVLQIVKMIFANSKKNIS